MRLALSGPGLISADALADASLCATDMPTRTPSPTVTHTPSVTPAGAPWRIYLPILMREWGRERAGLARRVP